MLAQGYLPMTSSVGGGYSKAAYPDLWAKIQGTQWVMHDLGTNFSLRSLQNQFIRGMGLSTMGPGSIQEDAAPNITGEVKIQGAQVGLLEL